METKNIRGCFIKNIIYHIINGFDDKDLSLCETIHFFFSFANVLFFFRVFIWEITFTYDSTYILFFNFCKMSLTLLIMILTQAMHESDFNTFCCPEAVYCVGCFNCGLSLVLAHYKQFLAHE